MSSLIGHVLGAEAALGFAARISPRTARSPRAAWTAAAIAIVPDLDVGLYLLLGKPGWMTPHRGLTHTLLFAAVLGLLGALLFARKRPETGRSDYFRTAGAFGCVAATHLLLDWLMRTGPGVDLFAPFWHRAFYSPVQLVPTAYYTAGSWAGLLNGVLLYWKTWVGVLVEAVVFVPLVVLAWKAELSSGARWALAALSLAGAGLSFALYQRFEVL